jgi:formylglycine-generating enzyme required for sulfatase activity
MKPSDRATATGFRVVIQPEVIVANSIGMLLRRLNTPPARFNMGSPNEEPGRDPKSEPVHRVFLDKPFFMALHEVTVGQFKAFVDDAKYQTDAESSGKGSYEFTADGKWKVNPKINWKNPGFEQKDDHPVVCVTWNDAMKFCAWLSKKEGKPYSLPTEAQWECCCRAGSGTKFYFGNDDRDLAQYAWYLENSDRKSHPVGQKKPNGWFFYDMGGNAWEWCRDWYSWDYYLKSPPINPTGPPKGTQRILRGGGWTGNPRYCRSAHRWRLAPNTSNANVGFRVVQLPEDVLTNSIGMKLKLMPTGTFTMGSPLNEPGRQPDEDQHEVSLTRPFYMGVHKVTVKQFKAFVDATKYETSAEKNNRGAFQRQPDGKWKRTPGVTWKKPGFAQADDHPVVCVSQNDARAFCEWLSKKEGRTYILPTEAQWEYCCRAGWKTRFHFGDDERKLGEFAWFLGNSGMKTHPVGKKKPNAWGLFDMHGNAEEITGDWYNAKYYKSSPKQNPPGPLASQKVVIRGSGWAGPPSDSRIARRMGRANSGASGGHHGFRVVLLW